MNALAWMKTTGVGVALTSEGGLELDGLEHLDDALYTRVLEVARTRKAEILAELTGSAAASPALAEVDRFFSAAVEHVFPDGTTGWVDPAYLKSMEKPARYGKARLRPMVGKTGEVHHGR